MTLFWGKFTFYNNYTFNLVQLWHSLILLFQLVLALAIVNEKVAKKLQINKALKYLPLLPLSMLQRFKI
jgi:hypothetical protein